MSSISDGIEFALQQARAERAQKTAADTSAAQPTHVQPEFGYVPMGSLVKQAAHALLADDGEDVTVGDLQTLMREFQ